VRVSPLPDAGRSVSRPAAGPASSAAAAPPATRPLVLFAACALAVAAVDLASKELATTMLATRDVPLLGQFVHLAVVLNTQSAFGVSLGAYTWHINIALTVIALILSSALCQVLVRIDVWAPIMLGLIAGAATGNLFSLVFSPSGVVDFVAVNRGDGRELVFNLADVAALVGLVLVVRTGVRIVRAIRREGSGRTPA